MSTSPVFQQECLNELPVKDPVFENLVSRWLEYFRRCDAYDRVIGYTGTEWALQSLSHAHARNVRQDLNLGLFDPASVEARKEARERYGRQNRES